VKSYVYIVIDNSFDESGLPREKLYIGKSNDPQKRFADHIKAALAGKDNFFYRAIRSHGTENFSILQIYECDSEEIAFEKEKSLIQEYRTYIGFQDCRGYNSTLGGDGFDSFSASFYAKKDWDLNYESRCKVNKSRWESEEEKEKQSKKLCEVLSSEEQKNKKHKIMLDRWRNTDYRAQMSNNHKTRWENVDFREKVSKAISDAKNKPESKEKIAKRNKDVWNSLSQEEKQVIISRLNQARKEKIPKRKEESFQKEKKKFGPTKEKAKETWSDPEKRAKRIEKMKEAWSDPEKRAKRLKLLEEKRKNKENNNQEIPREECS